MTGWYFQQFLKMGFALSKYAKNDYLIWDADTFPLQKLTFIDDNQYYFTIKDEYHEPYFYSINKLLHMTKCIEGSFIAEHMIVKVEIMKQLINIINCCSVAGNDWVEKILNSVAPNAFNGFSEFETYGTYVCINYPELYQQRKLPTLREGGLLYGRGVTNRQMSKLAKKYAIVTFEERHLPGFPMNILHVAQSIFLRLWRIFNIV